MIGAFETLFPVTAVHSNSLLTGLRDLPNGVLWALLWTPRIKDPEGERK